MTKTFKNLFFLTGIYFGLLNLNAQNRPSQDKNESTIRLQDTAYAEKLRNKESLKSKKKIQQALIKDYRIISSENDVAYVDTTLSIIKDYKFNYLRKDNFDVIQFANIGQTYNSLSYDFDEGTIVPMFGARARHFNYMTANDINYYSVPTPFTELFYKTAFQQGQVLDAFFTVNTSKQFNFSIAYKGLRSQGNYRNALTSTGNFRFTSNFQTTNTNYRFKLHIVIQDLLNQENGGLQDDDVQNFQTGAPEFDDRAVFTPNFENAENILEGKRYYLKQEYDLYKRADSTNSRSLTFYNLLSIENKTYDYDQTSSATAFFGESFNSTISDKVTLENFLTNFGFIYDDQKLGKLDVRINYNRVNYGYDGVVLTDEEIIRNRIKENIFGFQGAYSKKFNNLEFQGNMGFNIADEFKGNFLNTQLDYKLNSDISISGKLSINSRLPNYNFLLYQSDYLNYNWDNYKEFDNVKTQIINFNFDAPNIIRANIDILNLSNYTYFAETSAEYNGMIKPFQFKESIQYLRLKIQREFKFGKFYLDNTMMYQKVSNGDDVLNVPALVTRNTLYFSDRIFKNAMHLQTGITLNWFSKYNMNGYDPLLAEFYVQNESELGGFPRLDFFINAKVRQTRIFLKAEHFNSSFTGYNYFSAPNNPYRDFTVRFGLVWNFFL